MAAFLEQFTAIVSKFNDAEIGYTVCGGIAMAIHGFVRTTIDIEILVAPNQLDTASKCASHLDFEFDSSKPGRLDGKLPFWRFHWTNGGEDRPLNLLLMPHSGEWLSTSRGSERLGLRFGHFSVLDRDGLVELKRQREASWDLADIERIPHEADMATNRIEGRLGMMDQLWEVSIALMKAGRGPKRILPLPERLVERTFADRPEWHKGIQK